MLDDTPLYQQPNVCCVCGRAVLPGRAWGFPFYYCAEHVGLSADPVTRDEPWLKFLLNEEKQRRKRRNRRWKVGFVEQPISTLREFIL